MTRIEIGIRFSNPLRAAEGKIKIKIIFSSTLVEDRESEQLLLLPLL
jgi:hypothetical protein